MLVNLPYKNVGCWKDTGNRAIPTLEGYDAGLKGAYSTRPFAIDLCYKAASARGYKIFAVQHGGWCAGMGRSERYKKYGKSDKCVNGKGGPFANDVYQIGGKKLFLVTSTPVTHSVIPVSITICWVEYIMN